MDASHSGRVPDNASSGPDLGRPLGEAVDKNSPAGGTDIGALVAAIKPTVQKAEADKAADMLDASVRNNIANIVADLGTKAVLGAAVTAGSLKIVGARYDLDTGKVEFL
jgi:carbonic anhydrase